MRLFLARPPSCGLDQPGKQRGVSSLIRKLRCPIPPSAEALAFPGLSLPGPIPGVSPENSSPGSSTLQPHAGNPPHLSHRNGGCLSHFLPDNRKVVTGAALLYLCRQGGLSRDHAKVPSCMRMQAPLAAAGHKKTVTPETPGWPPHPRDTPIPGSAPRDSRKSLLLSLCVTLEQSHSLPGGWFHKSGNHKPQPRGQITPAI